MQVLLQITIIIIAAKIAGDISRRIGLPAVLGKLVVGVLLGSSFLGIITEGEILNEFSLVGVILLMFIAGLETDVDDFKRALRPSLYVGFGGIIAPLVTGYVAGKVMNVNDINALFLGMILSATSVSISVQVLKEMKQLNNKKGATILGAAVIDDIVIIVGLAFLMSFVGEGGNITFVILQKILFFIVAILISWKIVPWFIHKFTRLQVTQTVVSSALIICFTFAYFAEFTGVSAIIGAYIAGIAISLTDYRKKVVKKIETIGYSIFVPVFLTSVGISADFTGLGDNIGLLIIFSIIAIATKLIGAGLGAKISGFNWKSALGIGSAMVSRGEVALIMAKIGLDVNMISSEMFAVLIVVVLITTLVTPIMMRLFFDIDKSERVIAS